MRSHRAIALLSACVALSGLIGISGSAGAQSLPSTFSGTLIDGSGNPVVGGGIQLLHPGSNSPAASTTTASDGSFSVQVAPGNYGIGITSQNNYGGPGFTVDDISGDINLTNGNVNLSLQFPALATVDVTVSDATGAPVAGASVAEADRNGSPPYAYLPIWTGGPTLLVNYNTGNNHCVTDSTGQCTVGSFIGAAGTIQTSIPNGPIVYSPTGTIATDPTAVSVQLPFLATAQSAGTTSGVVSITSPFGTQLQGVVATALPAGALPPGYDATTGDLGFAVTGLTPGQSIVVTVQLPPGSNPTNILKLVGGTYVDASSIAAINGNTVTLNLTDGAFGDEDGTANGTIVDPLIPVKESPPPTASSVRCSSLSGAASSTVTLKKCSPASKANKAASLLASLLINGGTGTLMWSSSGKSTSVYVQAVKGGQGLCRKGWTSYTDSGWTLGGSSPYTKSNEAVAATVCVSPKGLMRLSNGSGMGL